MNIYTCKAVENLMEQYKTLSDDYTFYTLEEGTLGYGLMVLTAPGVKTAIVTEFPMNEWCSAHKVRLYNKCPEKYAAMVYEKFGDILPGYVPKDMKLSEYLGRVLLPH